MARFENTFCDECGKVHFVQVITRDRRGLLIKTKCLGADFSPIINNATHYTKHRRRGYDVIRKAKPSKNRLAPKPKPTPKFSDLQVLDSRPLAERRCIAEISLSVRGQFATIKVFEDATPDQFYEIFLQAGNKASTVKPRNLGTDKPVHIQDLPGIYHTEGKANLIIHDKTAYEKLLAFDPNSTMSIIQKNSKVATSLGGNNG